MHNWWSSNGVLDLTNHKTSSSSLESLLDHEDDVISPSSPQSQTVEVKPEEFPKTPNSKADTGSPVEK